MQIAVYDIDLSDAQWSVLLRMLPQAGKMGRPATDRRRIIDVLLYIA